MSEFVVENGTYGYKNGPVILQDISFHIKAGQFATILGPNGAGKTTLLRCALGLLSWKTGRSMVDGKDIATLSPRELWSTIAYVPQAKKTVPSYTVLEMVVLGRSSHIGVFGKPGKQDKEIAKEVIASLGIEKLTDKHCDRLSGGELQMVLIARALASEPSMIVLDEPESNLDFKNQLMVLTTLEKLANRGITCLCNTHYPSHALQYADTALLLDGDGHSCYGEVHQIVTEQSIEHAFRVKAVIGEIETPGRMVKDVVPLSLSRERTKTIGIESGTETETSVEAIEAGESETEKRALAVVSAIVDEDASVERLNTILHEHRDVIIGRMGLPCRTYGKNVISLTLDASEVEIESLVGALSHQSGIDVKATYATRRNQA